MILSLSKEVTADISLSLSSCLSLLVCYKASSPELMIVACRPALFIRAAQRL